MGILSRINRLHIIAAGGVVCVALLVAFTVAFLQPTRQQISEVQAQQQKAEATWLQHPQKLAALSKAQQDLAKNKAGAEAFLATMPKISTDPFDAMFDLHREYTTGTGPALYRFFISRGYPPRGISVPAPPMNPVMVPPVLTLQMQGFAVQAKSFPAVLNFLRILKDMPRVGVIGGIAIRGTSPNLEVTAPLTVYIVTSRALEPGGAAAALAAAGRGRGAAALARPGAAGAGGRPQIRLRMGGGRD